ncbi:MAG: hypothetical protein KF754_00415 [Planctomycetes bacterium]|nr:hypothetical protein [Planctomycetota bacterium]
MRVSASLGGGVGGMIVAEYRLCVVGEFAGHLWNYENQHGSLIGQCDVNGDRTVEFDYSDYGLTLERPILIDGRTGNISGIAHDGMLNITSVTFTNSLPAATILGAEVRVARPGASADRLLFATVAGTAGGTTIVFPDAGAVIYNAINGTGYGLTVLPFYAGYWGGVWSGASYSSGTDLTTFTGEFGTPVGGGALGDSVKPGMVVIPDLHKAVPLHFESVSINLLGSDTLTVKGDATGLGGNGTRFSHHRGV